MEHKKPENRTGEPRGAGFDQSRLKEEQMHLSSKIVVSDHIESANFLAGVDQAYTDDSIISAAVLVDAGTGKILDSKYAVSKPEIPYIPGFLSYREMPVMIEAINKLNTAPDLIFVDGNGILHPRRFGVACHVGLITDTPTIGVAKKLLMGTLTENTVYINKEAVARVLKTKEHAKPIYVSPGHKISLSSAVEHVKKQLVGNKLPLPLQLAHKAATKYKKAILRG